MPACIDLVGREFGLLVVKRRVDNTTSGRSRWECLCRCGKIKTAVGNDLKAGDTRSCGHCSLISRPNRGVLGVSEGGKLTVEYRVWTNMVNRCTKPGTRGYENYGGRGIQVSQSWLLFANFLRDMGKRPSKLHSIERKEVDGDYCKENCVWMLRSLQSRNRTDSVRLTVKGTTKLLIEWAEFFGAPYSTLYWRYKRYDGDAERVLAGYSKT